MAGHGTYLLDDVWLALDQCLPGWSKQEKKHHGWVYPPNGDPPFRSIPLGEHGTRKKSRVECWHVKKMARQFGVLDCVLARVKLG